MTSSVVLLAAAIAACVAGLGNGDISVDSLSDFLNNPQSCGDNEAWKTCERGSCAETTCKNRVIRSDCTEDCNYGCYCSEGFYRNSEGNCVTVEQCPPDTDSGRSVWPKFKLPPDHQRCGVNEVWLTCVSGSCAETTCRKRVIGPICTADCRNGCYCSEGFYRNDGGNCVTLGECPPETELIFRGLVSV